MKDETKFLESMLDLTIELAQKVKDQNKLIETLTHQIKDLSGITEDNGKIVKATCSQLAKMKIVDLREFLENLDDDMSSWPEQRRRPEASPIRHRAGDFDPTEDNK